MDVNSVRSGIVDAKYACETTAQTLSQDARADESRGGSGILNELGTPKEQISDDFAELKPTAEISVAVHGRTSSSIDSNSLRDVSIPDGRPWKPLFLRLGPLSGITCLVLVIISILVSLGVLLGSNGAPVSKWGVEPSAILAVCTAVANQATRYAAFQGLVVSWWYGAMRGTTIEKLHLDWRAGMTIPGAIHAGRQMGFLGLACIFSTVVAVDAPLVQKATHVEYAPIHDEFVSLNVSVMPELPRYLFTGYQQGNETGDSPYRASGIFNQTIPTGNNGTAPNNKRLITSPLTCGFEGPWLRNESLSGGIRGCPADSQCDLTVRAPALVATACVSHQIAVDYKQPASNILNTDNDAAFPLDRAGFLVDVSLVVETDKEVLNVVTGNAVTTTCAGTLNYTACTLEAAIADYRVTVDGDKIVSLDSRSPALVAIANNTTPSRDWNAKEGWHNSSLALIASIAGLKWEGAVYYADVPHRPNANGIAFYTYGEIAQHFLTGVDPIYAQDPAVEKECVQYADPRDAVMEDLNKLMFYIGYLSGSRMTGPYATWIKSQIDPGLEIESTVIGQIRGHHNVYRTNLGWFSAAAAIEILCVALVLPTYVGWWKLGRPVSFSPIEIAKAFEAPLLSDCNSNSSGRDIAKTIGGIRVRYGSAMDSNTRRRKLAFSHPTEVQCPQQGSHFET